MSKKSPKCSNCGITDVNVLVKHHISYYPEITIPLCNNCHFLVHKHPDKIHPFFPREAHELRVLNEAKLQLEKAKTELEVEVKNLLKKSSALEDKASNLESRIKHLRRLTEKHTYEHHNLRSRTQSIRWNEHLKTCLKEQEKHLGEVNA